MMKRFKKKIMGLLLLIYGIAVVLILLLLNVSYVQNNKNSISRILNMKFQIAFGQSENRQQEEPREQKQESKEQQEKSKEQQESEEQAENRSLKEESKVVSDQKEDSYIKKSYLVAKSREGTFYIKNMFPDTGFSEFSEEQILEVAKEIFATQKTSGRYQKYQFEISVYESELLIAFADIESLKQEEKNYLLLSLLAATALGILWIYPAWKITGKMLVPLEEANRLQKEFVLFAGHELKTPITVMKASLDMLEKEGIHSKYLAYAAEENEKMRKLVIELLDYSKMEYQEENNVEEKVNLSSCIEGISLEFEVMAFEKGIVLNSDIQEMIVVAGNEQMLQRMTETLLENAICHTEAQKEVRIVLKKEEKKAVLSVENQGKAISEAERERIFEKFYHASNSEDGHYGLGLAIAQSIAQKHHTEIVVMCKDGWNCFQVAFVLSHEK